jgi:PAS domain S-box-containing protein
MPKPTRSTPQTTVRDSSLENNEGVPSDVSADAPGGDALLSLLYRLPEAVVVFDRDWRITFANEEARRISRLTSQDLNSKTHWELYPETVGTTLEQVYRNGMERGVSAHIEYYHAPFDTYLDLHVIAMPNGVAIQYRDVSDRKRAEAVRDRAPRKFEGVFEALKDSIVCIDRHWNCTFANSAALTILKTDTLIGENLWTRFPSNNEEPFASNYLKTMEQRVPTEFEAYYPQPLEIWFRVFAHPFEDGIIIFSNDISDRKRTEALRDATAQRLNQVLEVTSDAIISFDRNWNYTLLNTKAIQMLGREDLIGKNLWEEYPSPDDSAFSVNFRRSMSERVSTEFEAFSPDPLNRSLALQCRPSDDGIVIFVRDITDRRRTDDISRQQRDLITFVQQASRTAFWNLDLATGTLSFDVGSYPVFGHNLDTLTNVPAFRAIVHPDDREQVTLDVARSVETNDLIVNEFRVMDMHGQTIWLEARSQTAVVDGKAVSLGGMTMDITDRKRSEEALAVSEQRYRVLTELSPQFLWMGSPDGRITYANQGFLDYLGFSLEDIGGDRWLTAFDPLDSERVAAAWSKSIATAEVYEIEARLVEGSTGESRWWWLRGRPLRNEAGAIVDWLGVAVDVHDRKTARPQDRSRCPSPEAARDRAPACGTGERLPDRADRFGTLRPCRVSLSASE